MNPEPGTNDRREEWKMGGIKQFILGAVIGSILGLGMAIVLEPTEAVDTPIRVVSEAPQAPIRSTETITVKKVSENQYEIIRQKVQQR